METNPQPQKVTEGKSAIASDEIDVSVVVVSYNTINQLHDCLRCINPKYEIIVVDNASADGSAAMVREKFPRVQLIENLLNKGFGAANNQGMKEASREFTLFLNSDCFATETAIDELAFVMKSESVVAVGGRLLNQDGTLQQSASHMLNLWHVFLEQTMLMKIIGGYWCTPKGGDEPVEVDQVMGACLMIRTGSIQFDESYFLYCEDTDLLYRLRRDTGGGVMYVPNAVFTHELGASSKGKDRWLSVARYNAGKERFFTYHSGGLAGLVCFAMDRFGALLRLGIWSAINIVTLFAKAGWRDQIWLWGRVLTTPRAGPPRPDRT